MCKTLYAIYFFYGVYFYVLKWTDFYNLFINYTVWAADINGLKASSVTYVIYSCCIKSFQISYNNLT